MKILIHTQKGVQRSTKEKPTGSHTGPNITVRVAPLLLIYILDTNRRTAKRKIPPHPPLPPTEVG